MIVVSLETSEMDTFVDFKLAVEKEECGRILSNPETWREWARSKSLPDRRYFVAKDEEGRWLGAAHWSPLGDHEAKIFPLLRSAVSGEEKRTKLCSLLLDGVLHEILKNPEVKHVSTRPYSEQVDASYKSVLVRSGFRLIGGRIEFKSPVAQLPQGESNIFDWQPVLSEEELPAVAQVFRDAAIGDPHALDVVEAPLECIREALSERNLSTDLSGIHIGYIDGIPAAYLHVQIDRQTGWSRITYMGLVKEFRGKGLGTQVHRHAFSLIRQLGGTLYHGGTSTENSSMIRLFEKHNCTKYAEMQEWSLSAQDLSSNHNSDRSRVFDL